LDFLIWYDEKKGALLKYRGLCGANLDWKGDQNGDPIVILSQIPEGHPKAIERTNFGPRELASFKKSMNNILGSEDMVDWEKYLTSEPDKNLPFTIRHRLDPIEKKIKLPISVIHPGYKPKYQERTVKATYHKGKSIYLKFINPIQKKTSQNLKNLNLLRSHYKMRAMMRPHQKVLKQSEIDLLVLPKVCDFVI
jgi:hypothetical protein